MTGDNWTVAATVALAICAVLQLVVLWLQWRTLKAQTALQQQERTDAGRQAFERGRLIAMLARRSLLETLPELDHMIERIGEMPHQKFAYMAVGLSAVEAQLREAHGYLTEATGTEVTGTDLKEMTEAIECFLRAADRVNHLSVAPERMGDTPPVGERKAALQEAQEDARRAIVHLENAARLTPTHALSRTA